MRRVVLGITLAGLVVVAGPMGGERLAPPSPTLTCDVTGIPVRSASVETTCRVENFPPNAVVTLLPAAITATTDASGRASADVLVPCCFPAPGGFTITATAEDGTTASTTVTVLAEAPEVRQQPTSTR